MRSVNPAGVLALALVLLAQAAACNGRQAPQPAPEPQRLASLLGSDADAGFVRASGTREFEFPRDHGPHDGFRNEWWYVTGNLDGSDGRRFGYELTLFRFLLSPDTPATASDWRTNAVFVGHFAVTDVEAGEFHVAERFSRGAAGLAGAASDPVRVWLHDWTLRARQGAGQPAVWQLQAAAEGMAIELSLTPLKPPVLQGEGGLSQKSSTAGNASWYYSLSRLQTTGEVRLGAERYDVSGLSWLDREWSSSALDDDQQGWDWFALQLDDGSDLMFYNLRKVDGSRDAYSAGSFVREDGSAVKLGSDDVVVEVLDYWDSPLGGRYPQGWRLEIPSQRIDLRVRPLMAAQELDTLVRYWEGAVDVSGTRGASRVSGRGYVELTGYADSAGPLQR